MRCGARMLVGAGPLLVWCGLTAWGLQADQRSEPLSEFHFVRLEYVDRFGGGPWGRGWWRQDWPDAEDHFNQGIRRLTRIDNGESHHFRLTDPQLFEHPWVYATQVGYWE